ncbi:siroheme decarboxylase subunit beta [Halomonas sp. V046]|uniref:siroheme decarboxylase subunit beta n=1 Tax=Halomonas sp. V046 TaxID=3459611 RepID=UPI004043CE8F
MNHFPAALAGGLSLAPVSAPAGAAPIDPRDAENRLRACLEQGLPLVPDPWSEVARQCGLSRDEVLALVRRWCEDGLIKRLGLVVHHRRLGLTANAMVVWQLPEEEIDRVGRVLAAEPAVTLCYRRVPRPPRWPYNLFCMIHGARREAVLEQLGTISRRHGLESTPHRVLFSHRAYRQCGGRYSQGGPA